MATNMAHLNAAVNALVQNQAQQAPLALPPITVQADPAIGAILQQNADMLTKIETLMVHQQPLDPDIVRPANFSKIDKFTHSLGSNEPKARADWLVLFSAIVNRLALQGRYRKGLNQQAAARGKAHIGTDSHFDDAYAEVITNNNRYRDASGTITDAERNTLAAQADDFLYTTLLEYCTATDVNIKLESLRSETNKGYQALQLLRDDFDPNDLPSCIGVLLNFLSSKQSSYDALKTHLVDLESKFRHIQLLYTDPSSKVVRYEQLCSELFATIALRSLIDQKSVRQKLQGDRANFTIQAVLKEALLDRKTEDAIAADDPANSSSLAGLTKVLNDLGINGDAKDQLVDAVCFKLGVAKAGRTSASAPIRLDTLCINCCAVGSHLRVDCTQACRWCGKSNTAHGSQCIFHPDNIAARKALRLKARTRSAVA